MIDIINKNENYYVDTINDYSKNFKFIENNEKVQKYQTDKMFEIQNS